MIRFIWRGWSCINFGFDIPNNSGHYLYKGALCLGPIAIDIWKS
jgi:hypothetical protein